MRLDAPSLTLIAGFFVAIATLLAQPAPPAAEFSIASLNLARETDIAEIVGELTTRPSLKDADLLLFQEVAGQTAETNVAEAVAKRLGYYVAAFPSSPEAPNQGLAILSRQPVEDVKIIPLKRYDLRFHSRVRFAVAATVMTQSGPVRVWNAHLDSRINPRERLEQLAPVLRDAQSHAGNGFIGGDFNTTHFQWTLNVLPTRFGATQVAMVRSAFEKAGFRTPLANELVTFPFLGQHLDWIFARGLTPDRSGIAPLSFSDHHAVWAVYRIADAPVTP